MKNTTKLKKGFTLIELLFVMAVISILAGFGISQMSGSTDAAKKTVAKENISSTITEATLYFAENDADYRGFNPSITGMIITNVTKNSYCVEAIALEGEGAEALSYRFNSLTDSKITEGTCADGNTGGNTLMMG
jgi:prepilin-type N-terminal cleavage/methylation domain-containing protein